MAGLASAGGPGGPTAPSGLSAPGRPDEARPAGAGRRSGPPSLRTYSVAADFLAAGEFLLLRPDHVVAWRGTGRAAAEAARTALLHPPRSGDRPAG
jgi:hypothetical protein